jgi:drug/metabolite transporter (DMT)-like permease
MAAGSGILYGSINVLVKLLNLHPFQASAIAYLSAAAVLSPFLVRFRAKRQDWLKILVMGLVGGALAPILLFLGLQQAAASDAALLLTIELVSTGILATIFLRERFRQPEILGLAFLLTAAVLVALASQSNDRTTVLGTLCVLGAAVAWGIDNTVSARLVGDYRPPGLIAVKGLLGGMAAALLVVWLRPPAPVASDVVAMAALGIASIAVSSILFYTALGRVGASRTSAMNIATTALIGSLGGVALLSERLNWFHAAALLAVAAGSWLLAHYGRPSSTVTAGPAG